MSILKALQKKRTEEMSGGPAAAENIVPFKRNERSMNQPPELLSDGVKIGTPSSAFIGQPDPTFGTALPDLGSELTAGAKLNAENLTRSVSRPLPDFVSWTVDPERVEPRLVAITLPNSTYCEE